MTTRQANKRLAGDLRAVARDAERLVKVTAGQAGETVNEVRNRMGGMMDSAKLTYGRLQDKTLSASKATDRCIRGRPYQSLGVALGLGLLVGILMRRR